MSSFTLPDRCFALARPVSLHGASYSRDFLHLASLLTSASTDLKLPLCVDADLNSPATSQYLAHLIFPGRPSFPGMKNVTNVAQAISHFSQANAHNITFVGPVSKQP
jgi:hypothetical protein